MALQPIEGQPGLFRDVDDAGNPTGPIVNIRDFREDNRWDTIAIKTGSISAGTEFNFFQDINNKRLIDTSFKTPSKLSAGESMVLDRVGLYIRSSTGLESTLVADFKTIADNAYYELRINDLLQTGAPAIAYPSGYGLYGSTNETDSSIVSIGVPATASAARLLKKQLLNQNHELSATLSFQARNWLFTTNGGPFLAADTVPAIVSQAGDVDAGVLVTNFLHGLIRTPVSK
jgi:hypothetical protein